MPKRDPKLKNAMMNVQQTIHCENGEIAFCAALDSDGNWHHATAALADSRDEVEALLAADGNTLEDAEDALRFLAQDRAMWAVAEVFPTNTAD